MSSLALTPDVVNGLLKRSETVVNTQEPFFGLVVNHGSGGRWYRLENGDGRGG